MPLIADYVVGSGGDNAVTLNSPAFTPDVGELLVVKCANSDDDSPALTGVSGGGLVWNLAARWLQGVGNFCDAWIYTARVTAGAGGGTGLIAPPVLAATYPAISNTENTTALVSPSFTPTAGELLVAKCSLTTGAAPTVSGGGLAWTLRASRTPTGPVAAPRVRAATADSRGNTTHTAPAKPAGLAVGDYLLAFTSSDADGSLAEMTAPAGFTQLASAAGNTTTWAHSKIWGKVATAADVAATTFTFPDSTGANCVTALVAVEAGTYDPAAPFAAGPTYTGSATSTATHPAPSMSGVAGGLLLTMHSADTDGTTRSYTVPGGMTRTAFGAVGYMALQVSQQALTVDGPTGTRTATLSAAAPYQCASVVIRPPAGSDTGGPVWIYTATAPAVPAAMTVSLQASAAAKKAMLVERWSNATLATTSAVVATAGRDTATAAATITTTAPDSAVSWLLSDWNENGGADPATTTETMAAGNLEQTGQLLTAQHAVWHGYLRDAATVGAQTVGLTARTGQVLNWQLAGIEILSAGTARGPGGTGVDITRSTYQEMAFELTSTAENSTKDWTTVYGYIEDIGDQRGYTGGIVGFTSATGDMLDVVEHYTTLNPSNNLAGYIGALTTLADEGMGPTAGTRANSLLGATFRTRWAANATGDPLFRQAQRDLRDDMYWNPALTEALADGVGPLGLAIHYDISVNHGPGADPESYGGILTTARAAAAPPSAGGAQSAYLTALVNAREAVLISWGANQANGRVAMHRALITSGNLDLVTPFSWSIYGDSFTISTPPVPPEGGGTDTGGGSGAAGSMVVASTWSGAEATGYHGMIVERWSGADVAAAPATNAVKTGSGAPSGTVVLTDYGSAITWVDVDWSAIGGTPAARGGDGELIGEYSPGGTYLAPFVAGRATGAQNTNDTNHPITLPTGVVPGELLTVLFSCDGTQTPAASGNGWLVKATASYTTTHSSALFYKTATGTDALTVTTAAAERSTHVSHRITNGATIDAAAASGAAAAGGGTTTVTNTATTSARTTGINETATTSHTVTLPAGTPVAGESLLVLFANDQASTTADTTASGWQNLGTVQQGTTGNHRCTVFYAANAVTAAALVVACSTAVTATWASFRVAGGGTPVASGIGIGANVPSVITPPAITTGSTPALPTTPAGYLGFVLVGVDSSTDTAHDLAVTWPTGWTTTTQTRRMTATAGGTSAPDVFTSEARFGAGTTSIAPGQLTTSISEQIVAFTVVIPDTQTTTTTPGGAGTATPPALTPAGGAISRLWLAGLALDTSAAAAQTLTVPGGFGSLAQANPTTGTDSAVTATAETTSASASLQPGAWASSTSEEWIAWTIAVSGSTSGGGGPMRMYAGMNTDPAAAPGAKTIGMTAPTGQAWTMVGIELLAAPVRVTLGYVDELEELPAALAGRWYPLGVVEEVEELPAPRVDKLISGPLLEPVDELEEIPPLTVTRMLPALGVVEEVEDPPAVVVSHLVPIGLVEEVEEVLDLTAGSTALAMVTEVVDVPPLTVGFGGVDVARSPARRGLPPVIVRGGLRVMAQNIITGRWVHRELPVSGLELTQTLSGPQAITGTFAGEVSDLRDLNLEPWGTWIHVEQDGDIRGSAILLPGAYNPDGSLELQAEGPSAYANRIPFTGSYTGIQVDPADVVRMLWAHIQSFARGNLGVAVEGTTSVRIGYPESAEVKDPVVAGMKAAATEILKALADPQIVIYADFTWPEAPDSVTEWGDALLVEWRNDHPGQSGPLSAAPRGATARGATAATGTPAVIADGNIDRPTYKEMALELTSTAENSTLDWRQAYRYIEDIRDGRGYTGGLVGFTTATGDMLELVEAYTAAAPGNTLASYVSALQTLATEGEGTNAGTRANALLGTTYRNRWAAAADTDPVFRTVQRDLRDDMYWDPALAQARADRVGPLGLAILYDISVNHGPGTDAESFGGIVATARGKAKPPSQGGNQNAYLKALIDARSAVLTRWGDNPADGRVAMHRALLATNNLLLTTPFSWSIYGDNFTISAPPVDPEGTTTGDTGATSGTKAQAAQLIHDRIGSGLDVFEDWTYAGAPPVVGEWNDTLLGEYAAAHPRGQAAWVIWGRLRNNLQIFEDWTWAGAPGYVTANNDALLDAFQAEFPSASVFGVTAQDWLGGYVLDDQLAFLAAVAAGTPTTGGGAAPTPTVPLTAREELAAWLRSAILSRDEVITPAREPYRLNGYELPLVGKAIDDLGTEAPFEYVEEQGWVNPASKQQVYHRIRIAHPRLGRRLDLNLTQGENLLEHSAFEEQDDVYADSAFVTGRGEGADAITGYAGVDIPFRLRMPKVITDKTIAVPDLAVARAHDEIAAALASVEEIGEIAVNVRHENSRWGTFAVGDEVLPRVRLPWLGFFAQWHRIVQITYRPDDGVATVKLSRRDAAGSR